MKRSIILLLVLIFASSLVTGQQTSTFTPATVSSLRAPAFPLITIDPYTSVWSFTDRLYEENPRHWTGTPRTLIGVLRVDGKAYRFMGSETTPLNKTPKELFETTALQESVNVMPSQTFYNFTCGPVRLELVFTSPLLLDDLYLMSRPVNYISWQVSSTDGKSHAIEIYFEASPEFAVNKTDQPVESGMSVSNGMTFLKTGTKEQPVLAKKGDDLRIDWGWFYLVSANGKGTTMAIGDPEALRPAFLSKGSLPGTIDKTLPDRMDTKMTALAFSWQPGKVDSKPMSGHLLVGYDDIYSIQYFGQNLKAYWTKDGTVDIVQAFSLAEKEYSTVMNRCSAFDRDLMTKAEAVGGKKYAEMCALTYRQSVAAHKLVKGKSGELLFLSKENFSNGCICTVDVTYPSSPLYLIYNPDLLKGMMNGIFYYSESGKWTKPYAVHDLGTYPLANGHAYGTDMPVEEAGNMLILATAIASREGNASYAEKHWQTLSTWADYLLENGLDPANQLCTDDFAGHLAHNANLSIKAIMGIAGYGRMAGMLGKKDIETRYLTRAREMATEWVKMDQEGDHFKLTFDQPGTWSQKYNLVWDKVLKMGIFPEDVARHEVAYYLTRQLPFGLPLDSRKTYTKADWIIWTATLASDVDTFRKISDPVWKYNHETTTRMPSSDWYETTNGKSVGFRARSVVGGYFMKLLEEEMNKKQTNR